MAATAIIGGAVIGGGMSMIGSQNAANTEANAAGNASQMQWNMFQQQQANAQPWMQSGNAALSSLNAQMANGSLTNPMTMQQFQQDPGYQFQLQQGQQAIQRSAASKGLLNSVGTQQNLDAYSQGMANTDYQQALSNFTNNQQQRYNMLSGLSQQGLQATGMTNAAGANVANNISSNTMAAGNAVAAGQMGTANAIGGTFGNAINGVNNNNIMNQLLQNQQNLPYGSLGMNGMSLAPQSYGQMPNQQIPTYEAPVTNQIVNNSEF